MKFKCRIIIRQPNLQPRQVSNLHGPFGPRDFPTTPAFIQANLMFSLNYPPSFLRSVRDEPYIFKFLWSGLFQYHIEIVHKRIRTSRFIWGSQKVNNHFPILHPIFYVFYYKYNLLLGFVHIHSFISTQASPISLYYYNGYFVVNDISQSLHIYDTLHILIVMFWGATPYVPIYQLLLRVQFSSSSPKPMSP